MTKYPYGFLLGVLLWLGLENQATYAQVTPDGTLSTTVNSTDNLNFTIEDGARSGNNLFHSFDEFSVPTNGSAIFNNVLDVANIFSRVTGTSRSDIDGLIQANGTVNFFLLNPNGILFGPNASLNIGGTFFASTADSVIFDDDTEFGVAQSDALLSINVPVGLQYGADPGAIINQSTTNLFGQPIGLANTSATSTLSLIGGDVTLEGGGMTSFGGRIQLGAVGANSVVGLVSDAQGYALDYSNVQDFSDIDLSQQAFINSIDGGAIELRGDRVHLTDGASLVTATTSEANGGDVELIARHLRIDNGANISSLTTDSADGGNLTFQVSDSVNISGLGYTSLITTIQGFVQGIGNLATPYPGIAAFTTGAGTTGAITIETQDLSVRDGAAIMAGNADDGSSQAIRITASDQLEVSHSFLANVPGLGTPNATGDGGALSINAGELLIKNGSIVTTSTLGLGNGGDLTINATTVEIIDERSVPQFPGFIGLTTVNTTSIGQGNGGDLKITAETLGIRGGAGLFTANSTAVSSGQPGSIDITASQWVEVEGSNVEGQDSSIGTETYSRHPAGDITIDTGRLRVSNGAEISTDTNSSGNGGNIFIQASEQIEVTGAQGNEGSTITVSSEFSGLTQRLLTVPTLFDVETTGNGGQLTLITPSLFITDGARISAETETVGNAGSLRIIADTIRLERNGGILSTTEAGNYEFDSNFEPLPTELSTFEDSFITAGGAGGEILIQATKEIALYDNSAILSSAIVPQSGRSGNIQIEAGTITLNNSRIETSSFAANGRGGSLVIHTDEALRLNHSSIAAATVSGDGGDLVISTDQLLFMENNSLLSATAGQAETMGNGGNITIETPFLVSISGENSDITANAFTGTGGNISIAVQSLFGLAFRDRLTPGNDITASSQFGINGTVEINDFTSDPDSGLVELPSGLVDPSNQIAQGCRFTENTFVATGRGGLPPSPVGFTRGDRPWSDNRDLSAFLSHSSDTLASAPEEQVTAIEPLQEATGMAIAPDGTFQLVASNTHNPPIPHASCTTQSNIL